MNHSLIDEILRQIVLPEQLLCNIMQVFASSHTALSTVQALLAESSDNASVSLPEEAKGLIVSLQKDLEIAIAKNSAYGMFFFEHISSFISHLTVTCPFLQMSQPACPLASYV